MVVVVVVVMGEGGEHNLQQTRRANGGMEALLGRHGLRGVCACVCEVGWVGGWLLFLTETNWSN